MASHIECVATRSGLEAQIITLTEGYNDELEGLQNRTKKLTEGYIQSTARLKAQQAEEMVRFREEQKADHLAFMENLLLDHAAEVLACERDIDGMETAREVQLQQHEHMSTELRHELTSLRTALCNAENRYQEANKPELVQERAWVQEQHESQLESQRHEIEELDAEVLLLHHDIFMLKENDVEEEFEDSTDAVAEAIEVHHGENEVLQGQLRDVNKKLVLISARFLELHFVGGGFKRRSYACRPTDGLLDLVRLHFARIKRSHLDYKFRHKGKDIELCNGGLGQVR